jgi:formate hydrogenlyase subunit 3/multisubunit Na+/H+ antiporter MnhD subunit
MYFVKHKGTENAAEVKEKGNSLPLSMVAPILILASLCIVMGFIWLTNIPLPLINQILSNLRMGVTL